MDDDVSGVNQHPVRAGRAFDEDTFEAGFFQLFLKMGGHGADLAIGDAGGDDHAICERGAAGEVDGDDVFRFIVVEAGDDDFLQRVQP